MARGNHFKLLDSRIVHAVRDPKIHFEYLCKAEDNRRVRFVIHIDFYEQNSYAASQLFTDNGWTDIVRLAGSELETDLKVGYRVDFDDNAERHLEEDYDRLINITSKVMGLAD